ncbi:hypothetical protein [Catenuloplanes japonicus]|uniref:hypothetical protein n=1 Tax=Catenuloplanes japonicus TaxID=33876 RepID=UPI00068CB9B7|nr:hypothetical protein [Catenuloplanes japonicus]
MTRLCAVAAPLLLLTYGILRWIDGFDGDRGNGLAWDAGHTAFLLAMLLFALLATLIRPAVTHSPLATPATAAAILGAGCFGWIIAGDLSDPFRRALPLPGALQLIGPLLFQFGLLTLLGLLSFTDPRGVPRWSPFAVLAGFLAIAASLDLLPPAAVAIGAGLAPLALKQPVTAQKASS